MIGIDPTLAMEGVEDTKERHIIYGSYLEKLLIIAKTPKEVAVKKLSKKVYVYPLFARGYFSFVLKAYKASKEICKREEVDVITTQDPFFSGFVGYLIKKKFGIPLVVQLHGDFLDNKYWLNERKSHKLLNPLGKYLIKRADGIRVVSKRIEEYAKKNSIKHIFNIPIYTDLKRFLRYSHKKDKRKKILFVGRLVPEKDIQTLIKAVSIVVKKHPKSLLVIVGDGIERRNLENLVTKLGIGDNVEFVGAVKNIHIVEYYRTCDVFVLPSYFEGWGRVVLEAMSCGRPVIMTDVGCAREVIIDLVSGFIVPIQDKDALAKKIICLLDNPKFAEKIGEEGRKVVGKYSIEKTAKMLVEMYGRVVDNKIKKRWETNDNGVINSGVTSLSKEDFKKRLKPSEILYEWEEIK